MKFLKTVGAILLAIAFAVIAVGVAHSVTEDPRTSGMIVGLLCLVGWTILKSYSKARAELEARKRGESPPGE